MQLNSLFFGMFSLILNGKMFNIFPQDKEKIDVYS